MKKMRATMGFCLLLILSAGSAVYGQQRPRAVVEPAAWNRTAELADSDPGQDGAIAQADQLKLAPPATSPAASESIVPSSSGHGWWTTGANLALVLALIVLAARLLRGRAGLVNGKVPLELVEVLGRSYLDAKQTLYVVRWENRLLLIGSGPEGPRTLAELSDPDAVERATDLCRQARCGTLTATVRDALKPGQPPERRQHSSLSQGEVGR